jgi:hypothetical protein
MPTNRWLLAGGALSTFAAALHIAVIIEMARAAERGSATPAIITFAIAVILAIWALYAFSGAGKIRRLPLLKTALVIISAIYLLRALLVPSLLFKPELVDTFAVWSSLVVLIYGLAYSIGTWRAWPALRSSPT